MTRSRWLVLAMVLTVAACASAQPTRNAATQEPTGLATFHEAGLVFSYPAAWRVFHYQTPVKGSQLIAYLATVDVPAPCQTSASGGSCADRYQLSPGSLVVAVRDGGQPLFDILGNRPAEATPLTVGGLPAYVEPAPSASRSVGADLSLVWTLSVPGSVDNYYTISADIRGPDTERLKGQVEALIASLRYDPPVVPLPTGAATTEAAITNALAGLAKDSPTWGCFPTQPGTGQMLVSALPNGPTLAKPQLATCTTAIEATPLQLWRMTLTLRLPEADPQAGLGQTIVVWVGPDGSPGLTTSTQLGQ